MTATMKEALKPIVQELLFEMMPELKEVLREEIEAEEKHVLFTKAQLAEKWGCTVGTVHKILKKAGVKSVGKRGSELEFKLDEAEEAKALYDGEQLHNHELNWKMRAMQQN